MLQKVLKYDLRHIFKYWWILAVASVFVSVIGGLSFRTMMDAAESQNVIIMLLSMLGIIVFSIGISGFAIGNEIFICERVYKNFFSDEGYLTFTLPVKRKTLLHSKILMAFTTHTASLLVTFIDLAIFFSLAFIGSQAGADLVAEFKEVFGSIPTPEGDTVTGLIVLGVIGIIIMIIEAILSSLTSSLLLMCCITVGSVVAKKNKILAAVGIYYFVSLVYAFILEFTIYFGSFGTVSLIATTPEELMPFSVIMLLFIQIGSSAAFALGLYTLEHYLLHKKLNLA